MYSIDSAAPDNPGFSNLKLILIGKYIYLSLNYPDYFFLHRTLKYHYYLNIIGICLKLCSRPCSKYFKNINSENPYNSA